MIESLNANKAAGTDEFMTKCDVIRSIYQDHAKKRQFLFQKKKINENFKTQTAAKLENYTGWTSRLWMQKYI